MINLWDLKNPHLFYFPQIAEKENFLNEEESKHCVRVLRLQECDHIVLMDGRGCFYRAAIQSAHPKKCSFEILETFTPAAERNSYLHLAVAPTKNIERFEWFLEKATEMGIDEITPIICMNSERREVKTERLKRVLVSAMKQSMHAHLPILNESISLDQFFKKNHPQMHTYIAHCRAGEKDLLKNIYPPHQDVLLMIGPEGDFTEIEVKLSLEKNFQPVSLGESRLRTETAAVAACFAINLINS